MLIKFPIENPPTAEAVASARAAAEKVTRYRFVIILIDVVAAFILTSLFWDFAWPITVDQMSNNPNQFLLGLALMPIFGCAVVFLGTMGLVGMLMAPHTATYRLTSPLEAWKAEQVLRVAAEFPELEAYRQAVVASRGFLEGDYEAMMAFADETRTKQLVQQAMDKQAQALAQLNSPVRGS